MAIMFFLWDFLKWFLDEKWGGGELRVEDGRGGVEPSTCGVEKWGRGVSFGWEMCV